MAIRQPRQQDQRHPHLQKQKSKLSHTFDFLIIQLSGASLYPNRSLDFGEIARLCQAACFSPSRRRSGLRRGVARNRMRTEAGKMPESLIFLTENSPGVSNDRFGLNRHSCTKPRGRLPPWLSGNLHSTPIGFQKLKNPDPVPWQPDRQQQTTSCKLSLF